VERYEIAIEVGPISPDTVARLKEAGHAVYRGNRTWRVVATERVLGRDSVRAQAHVLAAGILNEFELDPLHEPPTVVLRDPDASLDAATSELLLEDARRSYDPDPLTRPRRKWWQRQMELGLGERKGD
jgi:hypothetical protein